MIEEVKMYTAVCDNCGEDIGSTQDYSCWNDESYAKENAIDSDWAEIDGKMYCPKCFKVDDNDELVVNRKLPV